MKDTLIIDWFDSEAVEPSDNTEFIAIERDTDYLCYGKKFGTEEKKIVRYFRLNGEFPPEVKYIAENIFCKKFKKWGLK